MTITLGASETLNFHIWASSIAAIVYLNGTLLLAGLAIVRIHNVWIAGWPVLIILTGWILLLGGLYRMFAPEAPRAAEGWAIYALFAVLFAIGCLLTFQAYRPGKSESD
ncbi:MAG: hypothetical protein HY245_05285 [Rhizobiales bacterium]|nr:hypothetical protein [Hyphomicrobiales bacterium]MBI3672826.1 hypothetical protein [Hyphomicrobiales bacterium]